MTNGITLPFSQSVTFNGPGTAFAITALGGDLPGLRTEDALTTSLPARIPLPIGNPTAISGQGPGAGVAGSSDGGAGVQGTSKTGVGVYGESESSQYAGVFGINDHGGPGVSGSAKAWDGVHGESQSSQHAGVSGINGSGGPGIYGSASAWDGIHGESQSSQHAGVSANNTAGGYGLWARATTAGHFEGDVEVTGDIRLTNADCAEDFDIAGTGGAEPGTVMVLGDEGKLQPSESAYDKRVTGVISGAGNFKPGIVLDKQQKKIGRQPIALLGKVYCKVDASYAPVEIGDLLTTSPTPGHAMKADEPRKAFGAVIGKALRPLAAGPPEMGRPPTGLEMGRPPPRLSQSARHRRHRRRSNRLSRSAVLVRGKRASLWFRDQGSRRTKMSEFA